MIAVVLGLGLCWEEDWDCIRVTSGLGGDLIRERHDEENHISPSPVIWALLQYSTAYYSVQESDRTRSVGFPQQKKSWSITEHSRVYGNRTEYLSEADANIRDERVTILRWFTLLSPFSMSTSHTNWLFEHRPQAAAKLADNRLPFQDSVWERTLYD